MSITRFGSIGFGKISNVRTLEADPTCYHCNIELYDETETMEVVEYVARANDVTTGKWVYQQIVDGNFEGQIAHVPNNIHPSTGEQVPDVDAMAERLKRSQLLANSDWTQMPDVPHTVKDLWAPYRQALRDVPQQAGFPDNIVWPTPPTP